MSVFHEQGISRLNLPARAHYALLRYGVDTVGALTRVSRQELLSLNNVGELSVSAIVTSLKRLGLALAGEAGSPGQVVVAQGRRVRRITRCTGRRKVASCHIITLTQTDWGAYEEAASQVRGAEEGPLTDGEVVGHLARFWVKGPG